jgi:hypothetical protein
MVTQTENKAPKASDQEVVEQDDFLQEALEETFPASDPIAPGHSRHDGPEHPRHPETTSGATDPAGSDG